MSLFSALTASVSGLQAQANALSTISDNIANASTTGYKEAETQFEDLLSSVTANDYNAGGVQTIVQYGINQQGGVTSTTNSTDLRIQGNGFFVVQDAGGANLLTRAGSFTQNSDGTLINAAGFTLMGQPIPPGGSTSTVINGVDQLVPVTINPVALVANPTTSGTFTANLDSNATVVTPSTASAGPPVVAQVDLPSANTADSQFTDKTSMTAFDNLGNQVNVDVYFTNLGNNQWEVDAYNHADATNGGFPYTSVQGQPPSGAPQPDSPLASEILTFDPTTGALQSAQQTGAAQTIDATTGEVDPGILTAPGSLPDGGIPGQPITGGTAIANPGTLSFTVAPSNPGDLPNGQTVNINIGAMTQIASAFGISNNTLNGNAPATFQSVSVSQNGVLSEVYSDGTTVPVFQLPLATVASVNSLTPVAGDAYQANDQSGSIVVGNANTGGFGSINSDELESSTVDLATQLTNMVVAQNAYTANSKVFQVGSDLLQELSNLVK